MSYRLISSNDIAIKYPEVNDMPCIYADLPNGLDNNHYSLHKWIPVSERLPEDRCAVLVWCPERKNTYCAYLEKEQWWIFGAFGQIVPNEVIAWMPLPKPYEPQERSDKE